MMISNETADKMMDFAAYIYANLTKGQATDEEIKEFATDAFMSFCEHEGIDEVEVEEESECCGDCNNCDEWEICQGIDDIDDDEIGYNPFMGEYDWDC